MYLNNINIILSQEAKYKQRDRHASRFRLAKTKRGYILWCFGQSGMRDDHFVYIWCFKIDQTIVFYPRFTFMITGGLLYSGAFTTFVYS